MCAWIVRKRKCALCAILRKQNKMSENARESKVEMVISIVPKPVFTSVFWTFYSASVICEIFSSDRFKSAVQID